MRIIRVVRLDASRQRLILTLFSINSTMGSLQWHMHTFGSSDDVSDDCSDWDSDTSSSSRQTNLDLRRSRRSVSIDSTDSFGPVYPLDAFLESVVAPEDLPDAYELAITPDDFVCSDSDDPESEPEMEYDNDELLILNTPDALYQLYRKDKLQVRINASKRWELLCPDCAEWCQTGIHSGIDLWIPGQFVSLSNHRGSRKCHQKAAQKQLRAPEKDNNMCNVPATCSSQLVTSNDTRVLRFAAAPTHCAGLAVVWPDDLWPFTMLFPWERYHEGPDSLPFLVDLSIPSKPRAYSKHCKLVTSLEGVPCDECAEISQHITHLADAARNPKSHTNYHFLGLAHMQDLAKGYADQTRQLKLQGLNDSRKHMTSLTQLDDYHRLLMAISEKDIPRLHQVVNVALRNGTSIREIVNKLEDALEGVYPPRGYGANDLDIATLVLQIGGHQLLFVLNQGLGLPSIRTLRTRSTFTTLTPTIGPIRDDQFDANIHSVVLSSRTDIATPHGVSLMVDEIALEEMVVHLGKYNKIAGLCWKHSHVVDPVLCTYDSAITIAQKIQDGDVHLGKELTVIGVTCFGEDELYPILAAPTCKTEDASDMEGLLARAIGRWNATGAASVVGPVWSFATDGDATRCAAGHRLFLRNPLSSDSELYGILGNMPGLNTMTGDAEVTLDFDFKHIFKRFCTLICSPAGIVLNNGCIINSMMLARYLVWLPAYDETSVIKLLHPDDPQDVPRAIELMQAIVDFSKSQHALLNDSFLSNVETHADLMSITLLSHVLESILMPFINTKLSLSEQVHHLSCYSHLAFTIFRIHRHSFMPFQLYYDTQTAVKNVIFNIAKQQVLDRNASFFLGDCGDDRLELMFGQSHMIGGHNSGCTYSQALDRLGAAKDIDGVFKRHPELNPGHQCLSLGKHIEDVDHINRQMWRGDIICGRCDLPSAWRQGREIALSILTSSQIDPINYSFTELFRDPGTDILRPLGMNKYFGIAEEDPEDSSRVPNPLPDVPVSMPLQVLETIIPNSEAGEIQGVYMGTEEDDEEPMLTFEEALTAECVSAVPGTPSHPFPIDPSIPALVQGPGIRTDDYLLYKDRWIHKQTICQLVINKEFISKSFNRLERVHGYTKVNKRINMCAGRITDQNLFLVGDVFLTILRSARTISIAILRSILVTLNDVSRSSISTTLMKASRTTAKVTGQLLTLVPTLHPALKILCRSSGMEDTSKLGPLSQEQQSLRNVSDNFSEIQGGQSTWQVSYGTLQAACELLWMKAVEAKVPLKSIACITPSDAKEFPYQLSDGTPAVVSVEACNLLTASEGKRITMCPLCEAKVADMRSHIGQHILHALSNTPENVSLKEPVGNVLPCGFCGRSGLPGCSITIKVPASGPPVWETKCIYQHTFKYGFAETGSKNKPCRNVPLKCALCYPTLPPEPGKSMRRTPVVSVDAVWRYNMVNHILNEHEEYSVPGHRVLGVALPAVVWMDVKLTELEQSASRIAKERWQVGQESDKENIPASGSRTRKRPALESAASLPSK
ncbi:hypothetical protein DFJ58DRAFT_732592 [Suillus subalutaceus]|uniref:uncharacterized protein n=1 Tax=Suillus subalutaceus TaxID=48586 RepID=UPI001B873734|nr:uncharacterized protein DFJ58DRAFT_732592 [Suillus subalutaceus]KAG1841139.1 hypothetical protein DFJ58DRAFT_732592 [Suillus subalutaceus]